MTTLALLTLFSTTANAQGPQCGPFSEIETQLAAKYGEQPFEIGLSAAGHILYIFADKEDGSWTVVTKLPNGQGCMMDAGEGFAGIKAKPKEQDASFTPIHDFYQGYTTTRGISCCDDRDCAPAPYDPDTGLMQMPNGQWLDPRTVPNVALYFSPDGRGHACWRGGLRCAFIPGEGT